MLPVRKSPSSHNQDYNYFSTSTKLVNYRICQKRDYGDGNMNTIIDQENDKIRSRLASCHNVSLFTKTELQHLIEKTDQSYLVMKIIPTIFKHGMNNC